MLLSAIMSIDDEYFGVGISALASIFSYPTHDAPLGALNLSNLNSATLSKLGILSRTKSISLTLVLSADLISKE
ncbi:hypothetical protein B229_07772 [Francisella tularensis subsp. tularensis 70001275]|nr:hypothetical protein B229_07772 [Francisella tularensis subsp. tularensis 70001275]